MSTDSKQWPCKTCGDVYDSRNMRDLHNRTVHRMELEMTLSSGSEWYYGKVTRSTQHLTQLIYLETAKFIRDGPSGLFHFCGQSYKDPNKLRTVVLAHESKGACACMSSQEVCFSDPLWFMDVSQLELNLELSGFIGRSLRRQQRPSRVNAFGADGYGLE